MKVLVYILGTLLAVSVAFNIVQCTTRPTETPTEILEKFVTVVERDTVIKTVKDYDTVFVSKDHFVYDTIIVNEKVYIEDRPQTYHVDSTDYTLDINATHLMWYKLQLHRQDTITWRERTITETVVKKQSPWGLGLFLGPGYDVYNRQLGLSVGIGLTFKIK